MTKLCLEKISILQKLRFHTSDITSCDFNDDFCLVSGSSDKKVVVCKWIPKKGYVEVSYSPIANYKYGITKVKFLSEEQELIVSSVDGTISIFNAEDGELLHNLMHSNLASVRTFCYVSEINHLLSAGDDGSLCVWNLPRRMLKKSIQIHDDTVTVLCSSVDGKILLSGDVTGFVKLWLLSCICNGESNLNTPEHTIPNCHEVGINQAEFCPMTTISDTGKEYMLITCGNDNLIKLWKIITRKQNSTLIQCHSELLFLLVGHSSAVTDVRFNSKGTMIASTSLDQTTRLWMTSDNGYQCVKVLKDHQRYITTCCFSQDGQLLATGSNDKSVIVWDLTGERSIHSDLQKFTTSSPLPSSPFKPKDVSKILQKIENLGNAINSCAFSKNDILAAGGSDKLVRLWYRSIRKNYSEIAVSPLHGHQYAVNQVDFSLCGQYLASCSVDGTTIIWDVSKYEKFGTVHNTDSVKCCRFSPDSHLLAAAGDNEIVCVWNLNNLCHNVNMIGHTDTVSSISFTHDSKYLISGSLNGNVRLWCVVPCLTICMMSEDDVHDLGVTSLDFSLAETSRYLLASGGNDSLVKLWNIVILDELMAKPSLIHVLSGHGGDITCVRFSLKSRNLIASTSIDKTARIWDTNTGDCLHTLDSKESMLTSCAFSFDNTVIATGTLDRSIIIWDLSDYNNTNLSKFKFDNTIRKSRNIIEFEKENELLVSFIERKDYNSLEIPPEFICPITHQLMIDPVMCADGYVYEKVAIESWFTSGKLTSPMTNETISTSTLLSDIALKSRIKDFVSTYEKH